MKPGDRIVVLNPRSPWLRSRGTVVEAHPGYVLAQMPPGDRVWFKVRDVEKVLRP